MHKHVCVEQMVLIRDGYINGARMLEAQPKAARVYGCAVCIITAIGPTLCSSFFPDKYVAF